MSLKIKSKTLYSFIFLCFYSIITFLVLFRDSELLSDGDSYIRHAEMSVSFLDISFYTYPIYWAIVLIFGPIFTIYFPSFLSLLVSFFSYFSLTKLKLIDRYLYLSIYLINPIFFTTFQVALRNGIALAFVLLALMLKNRIFYFVSILIHPGVLPIVLFLILLESKRKIFSLFILLLIIIIISNTGLLDYLIMSRGYEENQSNLANIFTYVFFFILSIFYFLSFKGSSYKWFLPAIFVFWILLGSSYAFAPRVFVQALPVSLILVLYYANNYGFKKLFLFALFFISLYMAYSDHPLAIYSLAWTSMWNKF